jgi:hypothetical protein
MQTVHYDDEDRQQHMLDLDEIARAGARRMLALRPWRPKWLTTSRRPEESVMSTGMPWLSVKRRCPTARGPVGGR